MGTLAGTCEIVEVEEELNMKEKVKRHHMCRQGRVYSVGDDINQLFDSVNMKSAMKGKALQKHLMKQPMRVTSPQPMGGDISEAVNLKQALRGLCISQASEMAAMKKRSLKAASPSGISNMGTMSRLSKTALVETKGSSLSPSEGKVLTNLSETTPDSVDLSAVSSVARTKMIKVPSEDKIVPLASDSVSAMSKAEQVQKRNLKLKESLHGIHTIKTVLEAKDLGLSKASKDPTECTDACTLSRKPCPSSDDEKLKSARSNSLSFMKPIFRSRKIGRRKAELEPASASCESHAVQGIVNTDSSCKLITGKLVDMTTRTKGVSNGHGSTPAFSSEKAQTELVAGVEVTEGRNDCSSCAVHKPIGRSKSTEKGEFSQSSKSSIGDYSSTSEDSSASGSSRCCNRPHMSKDMRWEAIHCVQKQHGSLSLRHFKLLRRLGSGDIGTVYLAELVGSKCLFALKVMDNEFLAKRKKMLRAQTEREILQMLDHPFLPTLYAHFTTEKLACLVMEYCPGGDLHVIRQKQQSRCFSEQAARFYVAEVLLAMEYLHMLGIVYRDLKPENILVREDGHIMLTDFDLSLRCVVNPTLLRFSSPMKKISSSSCSESSCITPLCLQPSWQVTCFTPRLLTTASKVRKLKSDQAVLVTPLPQLVAEPTDARSNSFVGTHEYLAPEIVKGQGHGSAVDWWTYGIFLYELLYGKTPFKGSSNEETLSNIVSDPLRFPETPLVSFHAKDLIIGLLMKQPETRLGFVRGASEIKQHPFFEGLNWALIRCAVPPERPKFCDVGKVKSSSMNSNNGRFLGLDRSDHIEFELF